jgi:hypothetical protein
VSAIRDNQYTPSGPGLFAVGQDDRHEIITNIRRLAGSDRTPGSRIIAAATWLLLFLGLALLYVSFAAQFTYVFAIKHQSAPSIIEALSPDAGMVILSALGIGLALAGKASKAERFLIITCAAMAAGMNYAAADSGSWRSVVAYTAPPLLLAVFTDRVISVIRRHVLPDDTESAWAPVGRLAVAVVQLAGLILLYLLRTILAPRETTRGLRRMVLDAAPVPGVIEVTAEPADPELLPAPELPAGVFPAAHGGGTPHLTLDHAGQLAVCTGCPQDVPDEEEPSEFGSKREAFEWHYRRHPQFGDRQAMSQVARLIGERVGLQWGTSRTYAAAILAADAISDAMDAARECNEDQETQR